MRRVVIPLVLAVLLAPQVAHACSVCFSGQDQARVAFIVTTGFMTALPLLLIGGLVFWLRSRSREVETREVARREADGRYGLRALEPGVAPADR